MGVWRKLNPSGSSVGGDPLVASAEMLDDAERVISAVEDGWRWGFEYSDETVSPDYVKPWGCSVKYAKN